MNNCYSIHNCISNEELVEPLISPSATAAPKYESARCDCFRHENIKKASPLDRPIS